MAKAKLKDFTNWIGSATGEPPRARSNMLVARKAGLFTTTGKGRGSPDMTPQDAAYAVLMALYDGVTAHADKGLIELANMPLRGLSIYPNGPRENDHVALAKDFQNADVPLPTHFEALPLTPLEALTGLFAHQDLPYFYCSCSLSRSAFSSFQISIMDPDKGIESELGSERDFYQMDAVFGELVIPDDPRAGFISREYSISGEALADLYCLLNGITEADIEARDEALAADFADGGRAPYA